MTGASSVWNAMLNVWNEAKLQPGWDPTAVSPMLGIERLPDQGRRDRRQRRPAPRRAASVPTSRRRRDRTAARAACSTPPAAGRRSRSLLKLDGLLGCALVDAATGLVLAHETRDPSSRSTWSSPPRPCAQVLARPSRRGAHAWGSPIRSTKLITTAGSRHVLIRALQRHADLVLVALLEKHRTNLALARFQLLEVERSLP